MSKYTLFNSKNLYNFIPKNTKWQLKLTLTCCSKGVAKKILRGGLETQKLDTEEGSCGGEGWLGRSRQPQ